MKKTLRFLLLALFVPLLVQSAKPAQAQWFVGIHVNFGPPALPVYDLPVCPGDGYFWTPGYWAWDPTDGYYWVPGTWVLAPEPGFLWTPGWWGWETGGFIWHEGFWGAHVGFYGGINYGFGYWGDGFWGGRWQGGHFFYNTAVWNVGGGFHNVYRDTTVINNTTIINNHISYNGGQGGIERRPTPQEESYASERHVAPIEAQTHQVELAHGNPQMRASVNQGRPAIAATSRPGEFSGGGAVAAREAGGEYHAPAGEHAAPAAEGAHPGTPMHAADLQQHTPAQVPSTGNQKLDQRYQQQQKDLADRQNQEHQELQQRQQAEDQAAKQRNYNEQKTQKMEQKHQQQTQQLEARHTQQTQRLTQRQSAPRR
jgi:hypothetical protein